MTDKVETPAPEQGGAPASPTSNTGNATPATPDYKVLLAEAQQRAAQIQAAKDREIAQLRREHQAREKQLRDAAKNRLQEVGDANAEDWDQYMDLQQKASAYDSLQSQAEQYEASLRMASEVAGVFGLRGDDPRLAGAATWDDFRAKAKEAAAADIRAEIARQNQAEAQQRTAAAEASIASGEQDLLSGPPRQASPDKAARKLQILSRLAETQRNPSAYRMERIALKKELAELG